METDSLVQSPKKDLPGGARRLVQKAEGIKATLVNGAVAFAALATLASARAT